MGVCVMKVKGSVPAAPVCQAIWRSWLWSSMSPTGIRAMPSCPGPPAHACHTPLIPSNPNDEFTKRDMRYILSLACFQWERERINFWACRLMSVSVGSSMEKSTRCKSMSMGGNGMRRMADLGMGC